MIGPLASTPSHQEIDTMICKILAAPNLILTFGLGNVHPASSSRRNGQKNKRSLQESSFWRTDLNGRSIL